MINCPFELVDGKWKCPDPPKGCGWVYPLKAQAEPPQRNCPKLAEKPEACKVGDRLHSILRDRLGVEVGRGCNCEKWIALMNYWGPQGCLESIGFITHRMLAAAEERKWKMDGKPLLSVVARYGTKTSIGKAFARRWAQKLILEAIEQCVND